MFRKFWLGVVIYFRYMFGRNIRYKRDGGRPTTIAYGPHVFRYSNWRDKLTRLRDVGINEIHIHWSFSTSYDKLDVKRIPHVSEKQKEWVEFARSLGMKIVAQIRWNPTKESVNLPHGYPFWWWSGFVNLPNSDSQRFINLNEDLVDELEREIRPDEIIIANESAQLIQMPFTVWREILSYVRAKNIRVTVALNTWQPLKRDGFIMEFIKGMNGEKALKSLFKIIRLPYPDGVKMNFHKLLKPLPVWLASLDSIGINCYHYPTFNQKHGRTIRRLYAPMLANVESIKYLFATPVTCTETGLELESGVDRSIEIATVWWRETFDFWFFGIRANRVLIWEHDVDFFLEIVDRLGGLGKWFHN